MNEFTKYDRNDTTGDKKVQKIFQEMHKQNIKEIYTKIIDYSVTAITAVIVMIMIGFLVFSIIQFFKVVVI